MIMAWAGKSGRDRKKLRTILTLGVERRLAWNAGCAVTTTTMSAPRRGKDEDGGIDEAWI